MCHLILLIPMAGLPLFWLLPLSSALGINVLLWWVSVFVFYYVVKAMRLPPQDGFKSLIGTTAEVVSAVGPGSFTQYLVRAEGELWSARGTAALQPGATVNIKSVDDIKLIVEPARDTERSGVKVDERHCH